MADEDGRLVDITRCSLCNETSLVPKRLPCFHTFCINCLETKSSTSRKMPCPVCKTDFSLPTEGFGALHTDLFIQRLTKVNDILNLSSDNLLCDACKDDSEAYTADDAPLAHVYCVNCSMRLCKYCSRLHERSGPTKDHTLVNLRNDTINRELMEILAPNMCPNHTEEQLRLYCSDCRSVVCTLCFMESHQNHSWSGAELAANQFGIQIQTDASSLSRCRQDILVKIQHLQREKSHTIRGTCQVKASVIAAKRGLIRLVGTHADTLIHQIESLMASKLAEIETDYKDFTRELTTLKSCLNYVEELKRKGSPSDFCQVLDNLAERVTDLDNFSRSIQSRQVSQLRIDFMNSKLEDYLSTYGGNSVGKLKVYQGVTMQGEDTECWLEETLSKPERLQEELSESNVTINGLNSAIERQNQCLKRLLSVINKQKLELEKERGVSTILRSTIAQKTEELRKERAITDEKSKKHIDEVMKTTTLRTAINALREKLLTETQSNMNWKKIIENQKQELDSEKVAKISWQTKFEKSQKALEECRIQVGETENVHKTQINELNLAQEKEKSEWATIAALLQIKNDEKGQIITEQKQKMETLSEKIKLLEEQLELAKQKDDSVATTTKGMMTRDQNLVLAYTIDSPSAGNYSILGLTILGNELFLIRRHNPEIEIFDSTTFSFKHKVAVKGLTNPQDIVSCPKYECLYIMDLQRIKYVMRLENNGNLIRKWSTGNDGGRLSVTKKSTLIVTFYETNQLREYTPEGEMLHQVKFSMNSGIVHPWHAVELNNHGHFVVCSGCRKDSENKICIVDRNGNALLSFSGRTGSRVGQLDCPVYLAADNAGNIIVADQNNSRLLLLSAQLTFIRELVSTKVKRVKRRLSKFYFNEFNGKIVLADNDWDWEAGSGKVLVFDFA